MSVIPARGFDLGPISLRLDRRWHTHEPLCCLPCAAWTAENCCHLRRTDDASVIRVVDFERLVQIIDPSADQPRKHPGVVDDLERLGRIARRQPNGGLVGFIKLALTSYEVETELPWSHRDSDPLGEAIRAVDR